MGANSALRKIAKTILYPLTNDKTYKYVQAVSKAKDIRNKSWSEPELDLVEAGVKPGETTFDIGANFGIYSHYMSRALGRKGQVYAFEPIPFTFQTLSVVGKILGFRHNVKLINKGCGNENGKINFTVPVQASGALSTGQAHIGRRDNEREGRDIHLKFDKLQDVEADIVRLDDFLPEIENLSLIKADIEGAEFFAFRGAEKLISRNLPTVITEINPWFLEGFDVRLEDLTGFFFDKGYNLYFYDDKEPRKKLVRVENKDIVEDNYVFIHPKYLDRFSAILPE